MLGVFLLEGVRGDTAVAQPPERNELGTRVIPLQDALHRPATSAQVDGPLLGKTSPMAEAATDNLPDPWTGGLKGEQGAGQAPQGCLLYTSDAADE